MQKKKIKTINKIKGKIDWYKILFKRKISFSKS